MRLLYSHQVCDLDPLALGIGMNDIEGSKRSPDMKSKYLHALRSQAFLITSTAGIRITLQDGKFCCDDASRLLRQACQEIGRRSPE